MTDEKVLYWSKTGPLGPEKFENDLQDIDPAALVKSYGEEFLKELEDYVKEIVKETPSPSPRGGAA
jgi:hypothetical protein